MFQLSLNLFTTSKIRERNLWSYHKPCANLSKPHLGCVCLYDTVSLLSCQLFRFIWPFVLCWFLMCRNIQAFIRTINTWIMYSSSVNESTNWLKSCLNLLKPLSFYVLSHFCLVPFFQKLWPPWFHWICFTYFIQSIFWTALYFDRLLKGSPADGLFLQLLQKCLT